MAVKIGQGGAKVWTALACLRAALKAIQQIRNSDSYILSHRARSWAGAESTTTLTATAAHQSANTAV